MDTVEKMSANRNQNLSVLHLHSPEFVDPPITTFTDTGGSLRTARRIHSSRFEKTSFTNEKSVKHHSFENYVSKTLDKSHKEESGSNNKSISVMITTGVNSTSVLNSPGRELSPVRWCDREVDGVYLGKSGWVQVQQRSLDESRKLSGYKINPLLCPHNSVRLSNYQLNNDLNEKKESTRPFCLPLSVEKQKNRELTLESLRFKQECQSVSPPPITPIISPPPAFKDTSLENNFLEPKKTLVGRPPLLPRSKTVVDYENPPLNESSFKNSLPYRSRKLTSPMDSNYHKQNNSSHVSHAKSLDEDASKKIDFNEDNQTHLPISFLGFHSLDRSVCKQPDVFETNETDSSIDGYDDGEEEEEEEDDSTHYVLKNSPFYETLKSEAVSRDGFRSYHFPRNATETSCSDSSNVRKCSKRSSSLESCNSSCSDKNSSTTSLRGLKKEKENWQESEDSFNWDCKTLRVRRSRSLQLSEKHSPNCQSLVLVSTGKSWDQISNEKFSHPRSKKKEQCHTSLQNRHTSTTVARDGTVPTIPREKSRKHNLQITGMIRLENQRQEELFREAKKEARIISEFLNGSRSRAAARNLLMHRYLNQPEDEVRKEDKRTPLKQASPEPEYGVHFLGTNRKYQDERHNSGPTYTNKNYSKEYVSRTLERDSNLKPSFSFLYGTFETSDEDAVRLSSDCISNENIINKGLESLPVKKKKRKNKLSSQLASDGRNQICSSSIRDENQSFLLNKVQKLKKGSLANGLDTSGSKSLCKEGKQNVLSEVKKGQEKHKKSYINLCDESPSTSSSSNDIWFNGSCSKTQRMRFKTSSPTEEYPLKSPFDDEDSTRLLDVFSRRNESAPTDDDIIFVNCHQKSLSLPKSFLSERNGRICERQSNFFSSEKQYVESSTPDACVKELPIEFSKTAPATPVRDFKNDKNKINLKEKCKKSSSAPILDESCDSEWPTRRDAFECSEEFTIKPLEMNKLKKVLEKTKITSSKNSGASSETTLKKFKKRFSLKFSKAKENLMDSNNLWIECPIRNTISESLKEDNPRKNFKNIEPNVLEIQTERNKTMANQKLGVTSSVSFIEDHKTRNKVIRNTNCSSRDSGIHVENLGSMAEGSSESLYAVNLHGTESLRKVRQNGINATEKSFRPQTEINSQIFINKFKNDFLWKSQNEDYFSGVRRTNSDLGGQKVLYRGKRNYFFPPNISTSSFINKSISKDKLIPKDYGWLSEKTLLKRSFSQPLGVNDFSSPLWRHRSLTKYYNFSEDDGNQNEGTSEDEAISGSEMSYTSLKDRKKCFDSPLNKEEPILAEAVWDHVAMEPDELPFRAGDVIKVLRMCDRDWWWGTAGQNSGYFPSAFVRLRVSQEDVVEDFSGALEKEVQHHATTGRCKRSTSFLSIDQIRSKVIWELLNTERSFVKVLHDIADGFIVECKRRSDMFTPTQISTIFSNLESLLGFQKNFLIDLEARVNIESPHNSCVGEIFLDHKSGFQIYSEYCNSHPMAIATLQELYQVDSYNKFFEACRLMRGLNEIPLDGYLLTPVQRICKYPLQLAELLKYTKPEHPDHKKVAEALEAMKEVANLINERKRKMESLEKLAAWQQRVEGWEGEDLIEVSSQLIHQGDAIRITSGMWTSNITLFLFDHQIIYCKKDLLKKNTFIYKGRLCLDTSEITDIPDGRDQQLGVTVKNGLKIHSCLKNKWLLFCCRSVEEKSKWLESFAEERRIVGQDVQDGLAVTHGARQLAKLSAKSKRRPPNSSRSKDNLKTDHFEGGNLITNLLNPNTVKMSRRVGTWFMFGGGKKGSRVN